MGSKTHFGLGQYPAGIAPEDGIVATSGGYAVHYGRQHSCHNVINPRTTPSPTQNASVPAAAPTAMEADDLSTAAFVIPPKSGMRFIQRGSEGLITSHSGDDLKSPNWRRLLTRGSRLSN